MSSFLVTVEIPRLPKRDKTTQYLLVADQKIGTVSLPLQIKKKLTKIPLKKTEPRVDGSL